MKQTYDKMSDAQHWQEFKWKGNTRPNKYTFG